jgi:hypothetical protein
MDNRSFVLSIALVVIALAAIPVVHAQANVTNVAVDDVTMDGGEEIDHPLDVSGANVSDATINIDTSPAGVTVDPSSIDSGGDATLEISADPAADSGQITGSVDGESFSFDITVEVTPRPGFDDEPLDAGDIIVGESESGSVEVVEVTGANALSGVEWSIVDDDSNGDLSFSGMSGISGAGGTADWTIDVADDADQYEELSWTVELTDTDSGESREVDVEARVIYRGYIENLDLSGSVDFDQPRESTNSISETIDIEVENGGDLPLVLTGSSISAPNSDISAEIGDRPNEVDPTSTEEIPVTISANTGLSEGEYDISGSVTAETDDQSVDDVFRIRHSTNLVTGDVSIGDVPIGESGSGTTQIEETLGYNGVENIQIELQEGPNQWITQQGSISSIDAQGSTSADFSVEFDTTAEIGETYEWVYDIEGDVDDDASIVRDSFTVTATPIPLNLEPIIADLENYDSGVASQTIGVIEDTDERIRAGSASKGEISSAIALGDSTSLYLESSNEAEELLANEEHAEAQEHIIRAASSYNTMAIYAANINSPGVDQVLSNAESNVDDLVSQQTRYYETQISETDPTLLEEATIKTQLSQLKRLSGDTDEADQLQDEADAAFEEYTETVAEAEQEVQNGDETWNEMQQNKFTVVIGQPLLLNPIEFGSVRTQIEEFDDSYTAAISALETAGAESRAESVSTEYNSRSNRLLIAQISLFVLFGGLIATIIGIIAWTTRQMYQYAEDSEETVSGDFLLS